MNYNNELFEIFNLDNFLSNAFDQDLPAKYEDKGDYSTLHIEAPGLKEDDFSVDFKEGKLSIVADYGDEGMFRKGKRKLSLRLPSVDPEQIKAELKDGILALNMPIREEAKPREIKITA